MNHIKIGFGTAGGNTVPALALWMVPVLAFWAGNARLLADDATIKQDGPQWRLETSTMERVIALEDGKFLLKSFKNKVSGRELIPPGTPSEEFFVAVNQNTNRWSGSMGGWKLADSKVTKLSQGEQQLDICLQREALQVTKSYVIYPGSSIVREWAAFKNTGSAPLRVFEPGFLNLSLRPGELLNALDFHWMTGGENAPGSWKLKTEKLSAQKPRTFDSYEPFPVDATAASSQFPGDGVNAKIRLNDRQVWPESGWAYSANPAVTLPLDVRAEVKAGDQLVFLVNMKGNFGFDTTAFDPTITYADGETHVASKEFSNRQGQMGWRYQYLENGKFIDLVYYAGPNQWRKEKDNATGTPFVGPGNQHPDQNQDAARVWTAPRAGQVRITGSVCNVGNGGGAAGYGFRPGTSTYAPWYALYSQDTREGLFIGWDYFGHWTSAFSAGQDGAVTAQLKVAGHKQTLAPGESVTTPKAMAGLFREDLDQAGNECLDWQYRYLWDYTRDGWFPAIRMLGYWYNGTGWGQSGVGWTGGQPDLQSTFRKVFRVADLMRSVGADVYHRDWGWWDRAGDWNGPDFRTTIQYLGKSGMGQLIYAFLYTVDGQSKVAREHPDWLLGGTLDMSKPEVVEFMKGQLDGFVKLWGNFEWRNDSFFTAARNGDDTPMLGQDVGFRKVMQDFLDRYPQCAFQAVNGGGNYGGYDYTRFASSFSFSDGAVGPLRNYHAALLFPPDKTSDIPDIWNPNDYNKAIWRGLLCFNFDMTGDTWDPAKLEGLRELVDIYHYLQSQGVVGRWVRVYRPLIEGDDPTMYFQRLSRDGRRGLIIPKKPAPGPVTIKPKGLQAAETYLVSFHESDRSERRTGADLMERGVRLEKMAPGELIYLNLPLHPGSRLDTVIPAPPSQLQTSLRDNMGYPGVELSWKAGSDNNWVSYYEVFRDGAALDKVAKGTFYFDHSAGADLAAAYEVRTVDGAGNPSAKIATVGSASNRATVIDDAAAGGFKFSGAWDHPANLLLAHARTLASSAQKGAVAQLDFQGRNVLVFSKLGTNCGEVSIRIDEAAPEIVDTYSADDIWGVCIYRKKLAAAGPHQLRLEVLDRHGPRAKGGLVYLDAVRIEAE